MSLLRTTMLIAIASSGCTLGETDVLAGSGDPYDAGVASDVRTQPDVATFDGGVDITGTWAQLLVYGTVFNLPAIGQTEGDTTTIVRVTITAGDGSPGVMAETCAVEIDNGTEIVDTVIPDRFIESLTVQEPATTVERDGSVIRYRQDRVLTLRGVKLEHPADDALPTDASDPRIYDQDGDGRPGMTVLITGLTDGEVYVIQRDWYALNGQATGADWIEGLAQWNTEQVVLGSDNEILNAQTESSPHPEEARSYFRMVRVSEKEDCESLVAQRDALFSR